LGGVRLARGREHELVARVCQALTILLSPQRQPLTVFLLSVFTSFPFFQKIGNFLSLVMRLVPTAHTENVVPPPIVVATTPNYARLAVRHSDKQYPGFLTQPPAAD